MLNKELKKYAAKHLTKPKTKKSGIVMNTIRGDLSKGSSFFGGGYRHYGRYSWCIKYYGFNSDSEIEACVRQFLGEQESRTDSGKPVVGFNFISDLLGRPIDSLNT